MRTLAIGDIHGCLTALTTLVDYVKLAPEDTLITLGDYVDRGPDVRGVIDYLIELRQTHQLIPLRGNHELGMMRALVDSSFMTQWMGAVWGGGATLNSYDATTFDDVPDIHWSFLSETLPWYETKTHLFVHANLDPDLPLIDQEDDVIYWERFVNPEPHYSGKTMVCGHTSQASGVPRDVGHAICIDTSVYDPDGWLTCLDVETGQYWQANDAGLTREGN